MADRGFINPKKSSKRRPSSTPDRPLNNINGAASNPPPLPDRLSKPTPFTDQRNQKKVMTSASNTVRPPTKTRINPPSKPDSPIVPPQKLSKPNDIQSQKKYNQGSSRLVESSFSTRRCIEEDQDLITDHPRKMRPASKGPLALGSKSDISTCIVSESPILVKDSDGGGLKTSHGYAGVLHQTRNSDNPLDGRQDEDLANIVHANETYRIGSEIKKTCSKNDAPRIFEIYKDISSHHQGTLYNITSYYTKLKTFWNKLASYNDLPSCSCGAMVKLIEHEEREKVMQFLMGLNESYSNICREILLMEPFPTVEKAYSLVLEEENKRELVLPSEDMAGKLMEIKIG